MDFADILSAEIKKRKSTITVTGSTSKQDSAATASAKKYLKRSEIEAQRETEYLAEQGRLERERAEKAERKRKLEQEEEERREALLEKKRRLAEESKKRKEDEKTRLERQRLKSAVAIDGGVENKEKEERRSKSVEPEEHISEEEAVKRLRALGQPIRLFGETPLQRLKRLKRIESTSPAPETPSTSISIPQTWNRSHIPATVEPIPLTEEEMKISLSDVRENPSKIYTQLAAWFKLVLREWDIALASRPQSVKESFQGKQAYNAYKQASQYMQPLFRHFKNHDLDKDIFDRVCEIVYHAQNLRYVTANDIYLRLSIGNAAWPIGVTMVGIHERSAREKLHEKGMAAHIMSDEVTRKFLQSIKRCLSFCQVRWPPEDQLQVMG